MSVVERQKQITESFQGISDWEDRYKKIIQLGKEMPAMPEEMKTEDNKVKGCQSQVWIFAELTNDKTIKLYADSDALIVKGLVSVLLEVYSGSTPDEILQTPPNFIETLGFKENLSPSRANGLVSMIKQIQFYALAFKAKASLQ